MVDKGFNIEKELKELGLEINIPAYARGDQFGIKECITNRKVASKRIVVEQAIRKIKAFKAASETCSINDMAHFNQVFTVCTIISNFRATVKSKGEVQNVL